MTTRNEYDPGNTDAATLAALLALGARIDALQWELQAQRERADEYQRKVVQLTMERDVWRGIVDGAKALFGDECDSVVMRIDARKQANGANHD